MKEKINPRYSIKAYILQAAFAMNWQSHQAYGFILNKWRSLSVVITMQQQHRDGINNEVLCKYFSPRGNARIRCTNRVFLSRFAFLAVDARKTTLAETIMNFLSPPVARGKQAGRRVCSTIKDSRAERRSSMRRAYRKTFFCLITSL